MIRAPRLRPFGITRRTAMASASLVLAAAAGGTALTPPQVAVPPATPALSDRLGPRTWALAIPTAWLSVTLPGVREDDVIDLLGVRPGERATASEVATGMRVVSGDERVLVVELTAEDASSIAGARARGLSLVPILRSTR